MIRSRPWLVGGLSALLLLSSTSCTLGKPFVCAISTPALLLGSGASSGGCGRCDGRAVVCAIAIVSAVGAVGGLVTGIISDINYLRGAVDDPMHNLGNPFGISSFLPSY